MESQQIIMVAEMLNNFYELCKYPRPSGGTNNVAQYLLSWAENHGFKAEKDDVCNVFVFVPATLGRQCDRIVSLQAHMDMVPQSDVPHDWSKDPISTEIVEMEGKKWLKAKGTSLGADDGIGIAIAMTAATEWEHGPLQLIFTVDEETNMVGAFALKKTQVCSNLIINIDSETEGDVCIGGAGGVSVDCIWKYQQKQVEAGDAALHIAISGLKGGHSGLDIHLEHGNAVKMMARLLRTAVQNIDARLVSINAGTFRNSIPCGADAVVTVPDDAVSDMIEYVRMCEDEFNEIYNGIENVRVDIEAVDVPEMQIPEEVQDDIINALCGASDGVVRHVNGKNDIESSINHSFVVTENGSITVGLLLRSTRQVTMDELVEKIMSVYTMAGAEVVITDSYVGWTPKYDSPLLKLATDCYQEIFDRPMNVKVMHAGLECGIIAKMDPTIDIISVGPTILHPHSTGERLDIASVERCGILIRHILQRIR